jgi:hypothetical protein
MTEDSQSQNKNKDRVDRNNKDRNSVNVKKDIFFNNNILLKLHAYFRLFSFVGYYSHKLYIFIGSRIIFILFVL